MQTVLITGANGFIGHYLTELLLSKNYKVIATGRGEGRLSFTHKDFLYESLDFEKEEEVKAILQKYRPGIVVHGGAISKPDVCEQDREQAYRTNVTGTIHLLQQSAVLKSFFIYLSTDFVFSGEKETYCEGDEKDPVNYYGKTKLMAESEVVKYPYDWSVVRTILVYGNPKSGRHNLLTTVANTLKNGGTVNIFDDQVRTPTYVEDLVAGIVRIIEKRATGVFHLSGEDILTPYQMACAVADYLRLNRSLINRVTADTFQQPAKRPPQTIFDLSKAKQELGYKTTSFEEGLRKTFEEGL